MDIPVERTGDVAVVLVPVAELDASNTAEFKRDIAPTLEAHAKVVLDLSRLRFVDSSGLGSFLSCLRKVNTKGGDLKLCRVSKQVRTVIELVRMHRMLDIFETRDEALSAFHASGPHM
jgi:anti-sigma B factor antagonist